MISDGHASPARMPVASTDEVWVEIRAEVIVPHPALTMGYALYSEEMRLLYWSYHTDDYKHPPTLAKGPVTLRSRVPARLLNEGTYTVELIGGLHFSEWFFEPGTGSPSVALSIQGGLRVSPYWLQRRPGDIAPLLHWDIEQ